MSAAFTISSWLMSAAAFRPSLGEEMTPQVRQAFGAPQLDVPTLTDRASTLRSDHAL